MKVLVKFVAVLRDITGRQSIELEIPEGSTLSDLLSKLTAMYPKLDEFNRVVGGLSESIVVLVNGREAEYSYELKEGDTIVLLPPASGGLYDLIY